MITADAVLATTVHRLSAVTASSAFSNILPGSLAGILAEWRIC